MACELTTIQVAACESHIGRVTDSIMLLQLTAQSMATWLEGVSPGTEVTLEAIQQRACESGIGWEHNEINLLRLIAQNLCNQIE